MTDSYKDFIGKVKNIKNNRVHKITNSLGIYDGFKYYRKNKPIDKKYVLTASQYYTITRKINELLIQSFLQGSDIVFPLRLGRLEARKYETKCKFNKEGKLINNFPIDWDKTLKLWYEDEEAYNNKTIVRAEEKEVFNIYYNRIKGDYTNKVYYDFKPNRDFKIRFKKYIKEGLVDAFIFN